MLVYENWASAPRQEEEPLTSEVMHQESPDQALLASMMAREGGGAAPAAEFKIVGKRDNRNVFSRQFSGDEARLVCSSRGFARIIWSADSQRVLFYAPKEFPAGTERQLICKVDIKTLKSETKEIGPMRADRIESFLKELVEEKI